MPSGSTNFTRDTQSVKYAVSHKLHERKTVGQVMAIASLVKLSVMIYLRGFCQRPSGRCISSVLNIWDPAWKPWGLHIAK